MTTIQYYLTLASPWAYLGHAPFHALAERYGAAIDYRPLPLGRLFEASGGLPLARRHPFRQRYRLMELQRWRARRGVTLSLTARRSPLDPTLADGVALAILARGASPAPYLALAHAALWAREQNLGDEAVLAPLVAEAGFDPTAILNEARGPAVAETYERNLETAKEAGIFGAPSYVVEGEIFWGQDRLDLLEDRLRTGRPPYGGT